MILVTLVAFGILVFGIIGWVGIGAIIKIERDQKKAEGNSAEVLDSTFDGRSDVTFNLNMRTLKYETVILGAKERGYTLAHQAGDPNGAMTLLFEKA